MQNRPVGHPRLMGNTKVALAAMKSRRPVRPELQAAEEFVELFGGVEVGFEVAGTEAFTKIFEAAGEEVECGG